MTIERFWEIVDATNDGRARGLEARTESLENILGEEQPSELIEFEAHYREVHRKAYDWNLWGAAYVMNGGCSDDGFHYFRDWLISEGRETFEGALKTPDSLAGLPHTDPAELESFGQAARTVYETKTKVKMPYVPSAALKPTGVQWEEDELPAKFPLLWAKYTS